MQLRKAGGKEEIRQLIQIISFYENKLKWNLFPEVARPLTALPLQLRGKRIEIGCFCCICLYTFIAPAPRNKVRKGVLRLKCDRFIGAGYIDCGDYLVLEDYFSEMEWENYF